MSCIGINEKNQLEDKSNSHNILNEKDLIKVDSGIDNEIEFRRINKTDLINEERINIPINSIKNKSPDNDDNASNDLNSRFDNKNFPEKTEFKLLYDEIRSLNSTFNQGLKRIESKISKEFLNMEVLLREENKKTKCKKCTYFFIIFIIFITLFILSLLFTTTSSFAIWDGLLFSFILYFRHYHLILD